MPAAWWGLWAFALLANLRPLLTGYSSGLAVAPGLAALFLTPRPPLLTADGRQERGREWLVLAALAAVNLLGQGLTPGMAFNAPQRWLDTSLGPIAVPASPQAEEMAAIGADLQRLAPADQPIFATGWGAGWYLLAGRANPTAFDVVLEGLGTNGGDAAAVQDALRRRPPVAVIVPIEQWDLAPPGSQRGRDADAAAVRGGLAAWWEVLARDYVDVTPEGGAGWTVLTLAR